MKIFLLLAILLCPELALAQASGTSSINLTPLNTDLSLIYLSNMFGAVDGVLYGTGSQILGSLFGVFNSAVLVLGGIVILYTLLISTLNTANEGEVLGKRWSSVWIPLRSVAGIALLVPKATSGYSLIQIFMMWVIVQGIGAADSIWNASLDYLSRGGSIIQQNISYKDGGSDKSTMINNSSALLRSLTCSYMVQKQIEKYQQANGSTSNPPPDFYQGILSQFQANGSTIGSGTIYFPYTANNYLNTNGVCGNASWNPVNATLPSFMYQKNDRTKPLLPEYANVVQTISQSRTLAVQSMVNDLFPVARAIVNNYMTLKSPLGQLLDVGPPPLWGSTTTTAPLLQAETIVNAASLYYSVMEPTLNLLSQSTNNQQAWIADARTQGWALAGRFYFNIVQMSGSINNMVESNAPTFNAPTNDLKTNTTIASLFVGGGNSTWVRDIDDLINNSSANSVATVGVNSPFISGSIAYAGSLTPYGIINSANSSVDPGNKTLRSVLSAFSAGIKGCTDGFYSLMNSQSENANPILALAVVGNSLINFSCTVFLTVSVIFLAVGIGLGAAWGFAFAAAVIGMVVPLMGLLTPILLTLLVVGFTLCFYLPVVPYIIFTLGVIGWFIAVVEAIVAAPLVALGIAHPEGQEILGKAEPAVILLVNVFLRPTLMIFGLLVGMMLSYVSIWLLNQGFLNAFQFTSQSTTGFTGTMSSIAMFCLYTLIALQLVQKSFSLIHLIPDEVLKWIGGNIKGMGGDIDAAEQRVAGGMQKAGETYAKPISETPGAAGGFVKSMGEVESAKEKQKERGSSDIGLSSGSGGGGAQSSVGPQGSPAGDNNSDQGGDDGAGPGKPDGSGPAGGASAGS